MSTTLEPNSQISLHQLTAPTPSNGKAGAPLSLAATRPGFWRNSAPKLLRKEKLEPGEAWNVYRSSRRTPRSVAELCGGRDTPLRWAADHRGITKATDDLLALAGELASPRQARKYAKAPRSHELRTTLAQWLAGAKSTPAGYELAVGCLAAAHVLGAEGCSVDADLGWKLLDFLVEAARHAQSWRPEAVAEPIVAQQMLAGELPLTLSYLFPEMAPLVKLRRPASDRLSEGLIELLNGQGLPRATYVAALRPLAACWTRCRAIGKEAARGKWSKKAQWQYEFLVRQGLRLTAPDGSQLLTDDDATAWPADFLRTALRLGGAKKDVAAARALVGKSAVRKGLDVAKGEPAASYNCEWSALAVMRSGWKPTDAVVAVNYSAPQLRLDVWAANRRIFAGAWAAESRINGAALEPTGKWDELCWFTDKDVDYLELSLALQDGARLERQILLAKREGFLLLADHLQTPQQASLEHSWQLPLGPGLLFCGEGETRDGLLVDGQPLGRLVPLALPEWRIDPRVGELSLAGGAIRLSQRTMGRSMACPLFVDLRGKRASQASTWRQLTVAELLDIKPADVAVSYRVQAGGDQWVYYRSQGPRGNRTFLGQNTSSECLVARFKAPSGEIDNLLEIEG